MLQDVQCSSQWSSRYLVRDVWPSITCKKQTKNNVVSAIFKTTLKRQNIVTSVNMKKMLLFISFPMVYYMLYSDEWFKSFMYSIKNTFLRIQKNILNRREYEKLNNTKNLRVCNSFPSAYHFLNSGKWFGSYRQKHHVINRVKFKQTCPRNSTTSQSAFSFAMNA